MAKRKFKLSLGFVIMLIQLWMLINIKILFGENYQDNFPMLVTYLIFMVVILSYEGIRNELFEYQFRKNIIKIILWFIGSLFILSLVKYLLIIPLLGMDTGISLGVSAIVIFVHGFYVSVIEEIVFRNYLAERIGHTWANVIFAVFHWAVLGGNLISMFFMFLLGMTFSFFKKRFSPKSNASNVGIHWAWNIFRQGLLN